MFTKKENRLILIGLLMLIAGEILIYLALPDLSNIAKGFIVSPYRPFVPIFKLISMVGFFTIIIGVFISLKLKNRTKWWALMLIPAWFLFLSPIKIIGIIFIIIIMLLKNKNL